MITAGIDMGAKNIKAVVLQGGEVVGRALQVAGFEAEATARAVLAAALEQCRLGRGDLSRLIATGVGREDAPDKDDTRTEVGCAARGAVHLYPDVRTVIDVGVEEARAIRTNEAGKVVDFAINEKCASGTGAFTEAIARALEVPIEELGPLSLRSTQAIPMNAQCAVFAESEVVSLIHSNIPKPDIARAVHDAIASRIVSMVRKVGHNPPLALIGGMALNTGFVAALKRGLATDALSIPEHPEFIVALGAALVAADGAKGA